MRISLQRSAHRSSLTLPACVSALLASLLLAGPLVPALAAPDDPVAFPAAAGIRPTDQPAGPLQIEPEPSTLSQYVSPEDSVIFDFDNTTIYTINSQGSTAGAATVVASPSVGGGTAFT